MGGQIVIQVRCLETKEYPDPSKRMRLHSARFELNADSDVFSNMGSPFVLLDLQDMKEPVQAGQTFNLTLTPTPE